MVKRYCDALHLKPVSADAIVATRLMSYLNPLRLVFTLAQIVGMVMRRSN